jgi:hypothetical protein
MRFAISREHKDFYDKHQMIECEDLLTASQIAELKSDPLLNLNSAYFQNMKNSPEVLYKQGRDLWRDSNLVKKIVFSRGLSEIAAKLTEHQVLRIGYDQALSCFGQGLHQPSDQAFIKFFQTSHRLEEFSCLQGNACGLILCLEPAEDGVDILGLPHRIGNGVFVSPQASIDFSFFSRAKKGLFLLIVYAKSNAVFIQSQDPNAAALKQVGYNLGDRLNDKKNPIIYRENG